MSSYDQFDYREKPTFWGRFGFAIGIVGVGAVVVVLFSQMFTGHSGPAPRRAQEVVMIRPLSPLPPPPPPPPQELTPRMQNQEQTLVNDQDVKPAEQPAAEPAASLGTGIQGNGPGDGFGLGRRDTGLFAGGGAGGSGTGNPYGSYFAQIRDQLGEALRQNALTRDGSFDVKVRIWADLTGRITRARLVQSTGEPAIDRAITDGVLLGRRLPDTPDGMRMPIELHFSARRPN